MPIHLASTGLAFAVTSDFLQSPTSTFTPAGTPAHDVAGLSWLVWGITGAIFVVVGGLLLYATIRFRHRPSSEADADQEPAQVYGSNQIELSWTVVPVLITVMLFLATARVIFSTERRR